MKIVGKYLNKDLQALHEIDSNQNTLRCDSASSSSMSQVNAHLRKRFLTQYSLVQSHNRSQTPMPRSNTGNDNDLLLNKPYPRKFQRSQTPTY
jgi:hypothetical protein